MNYCRTKLKRLSHMTKPIKGNNACEVRACFHSGVVDCEIGNKNSNNQYSVLKVNSLPYAIFRVDAYSHYMLYNR